MKKVVVEIPNDVLTDVIDVLVKKLEQTQSKMDSLDDILNDTQYRYATLENRLHALNEENRWLRARLEHEDENWEPRPKESVEPIDRDCEDF